MQVNEKLTVIFNLKPWKSGLLVIILVASLFVLVIPQGMMNTDHHDDGMNAILKLNSNTPQQGENDALSMTSSVKDQQSSVNYLPFTPSPLSKLLLEPETLAEDAARPRNQQLLAWESSDSGELMLPVLLRVRSTSQVGDVISFIKSSPIPIKVRDVVKTPFPLIEVLVPLSEANNAYKLFNNHPSLKYFEPEVILRASTVTAATTNDPITQWGLDAIDAPRAWTVTTGSKEVKVAIIDSGVDLDHPDLKENIGSLGRDWIDGDDVPDDANGHGTHVAGIVAAVMNNSFGIAGIANITLHVERILDAKGEGSPLNAVKAIENAVLSGVQVITASWGSFGSSQVLKDVIDWAFDQGVMMIAASGNQGQQREFYPAAFPKVLAVGATDSADNRASFSNYGEWIDVVAPGVNIKSTYPTEKGNFTTLSGTSMAAPHVAGVAALALSVQPNLSPQMLMNILRHGTNDLGTPGKDPSYGYGLINASKVVHLLSENIATPLLANLHFNISTPFVGETISGTLELYNAGVSNLTSLNVSIKLDDGTFLHQFSGVSIPVSSSTKLSFDWQVPSTVQEGFRRVVIEVTDINNQLISVLDLSTPETKATMYIAPLPKYVVLESSLTSWISLDASNSQVLPLEDDDARSLALPFNFSFFDVNVDRIWIGSNGFLSFKGPIFDYYSQPFPILDTAHSAMIAFAWTDLSPPSNPSMVIRTNVTLERAVIQFLSMGHYSGGILLGDVQVVLWKDGSIDVRYRNFDFSRDVGVVMGLNLGRKPTSLESINATWSVTWSPPTWKGDTYSVRIMPLHLKPVSIIPSKMNLHLNTTQSEWSWNVNHGQVNNITQFTLLLDGNVVHDGVPTSSTLQLTHESEGTHVLSLYVKDIEGNEFWDNVSFTVDVTNPVVVASLPDNATSVSSSNSVLISWNVADVHSDVFVRILLDGWPLAEGSSGSVSVSYWGKPGWHELQLVAFDSAGNRWIETRKIHSTDAQVFVDSRFRIQPAINFNGPYSAFLARLKSNFPFSSHLELQGDNILDRYLLARAGILVVPHAEFSPDWWQVTTLMNWGLRRGGLLVFGPPRDATDLSGLIGLHDIFVDAFSVQVINLESVDGVPPFFAKDDLIGPKLGNHPLSVGINGLQWSSVEPMLGYRSVPCNEGSLSCKMASAVTKEHAAFYAYPINTSQSENFEIIDLLLPLRAVNDPTRRMLFIAESTPFLDVNAYGYSESLTTKLANNIVKWLLPKFYSENFTGLTFLRPLTNETIVASSMTGYFLALQLAASSSSQSVVSLFIEWQAYLSTKLQAKVSLAVDNSLILVNETLSLYRPVQHRLQLPLTEGPHVVLLSLHDVNSLTKIVEATLTFNLVIVLPSSSPSSNLGSTMIVIPPSFPLELLLLSGIGLATVSIVALGVALINRRYLRNFLKNAK